VAVGLGLIGGRRHPSTTTVVEHGGRPVNASVDDSEIVDLGEEVLVNQVQTSLLWRGTFSGTILDKAGIRFLTFGLQGFTKGVVVLINMQS